MVKKFIINGKGEVGKDTFVNFIAELEEGQVENVSSVDEIKVLAAEYFGWKGEKTDYWRKILSDLKDLQTNSCNGPFEYIKSCIEDPLEGTTIQFFHVREPEEINKLVQYDNSIKTILIYNDSSTEYGNHADDNCFNYNYDYNINNSGTIEEFKEKAKTFYEGIK